MKNLSLILSIGILTFSFLGVVSLHAEEANADDCIYEVENELAREHRIFRTILFGHDRAEDLNVGAVEYEIDGSIWYKIDANQWRSVSDGFVDTTHYNALINNRSEITAEFGRPDRKGIFETKRVTTSELIPYIGTSLHAFQCRLLLLCETVNVSKAHDEDTSVEIDVSYPGCMQETRESIPECHINNERPISDDIMIVNNCEEAITQLLEQEAEIIDLAIQYDAAYRTLLQIAGNVDIFIQEFHWPMTHSLRQAIDVMGSFGRIPCFLSSCEAYPPLD